MHFWACFLKSCLARPCTRLQGRPCRDSCSLRSCEPKSLFGKRPACLQSCLLRPWGSSRSGSCLRRWHCRNLAPKLSNVPLERQACSLWNPFHLCYSQTSETVLSASILLLYLTSISIRMKGSQSTTSHKRRVRGQEETVLSTSTHLSTAAELLHVLIPSARNSFNVDLLLIAFENADACFLNKRQRIHTWMWTCINISKHWRSGRGFEAFGSAPFLNVYQSAAVA